MHTIIQRFLFLSTLASLYIICNIGLNILPALATSPNAENINNVLLNLSYSYFAGVIFYFFISYLPGLIQRKKIQPILDTKASYIKDQVAAFIHSFNTFPKNNDIVHTITDTGISTLFRGNNLNDRSYYSIILGAHMSNADYINFTKSHIIHNVDGILFYKDYLSYRQILILEQIKDSTFLMLFVRPDIYTEVTFQDECAKEFSALIKLVRQI